MFPVSSTAQKCTLLFTRNYFTRSQCEQMRTLLSKRLTKEIVADWGTQIEMKNRLECEAQHEERMWAELSLRDVEEKVPRQKNFLTH